jgi:hypothetical protein
MTIVDDRTERIKGMLNAHTDAILGAYLRAFERPVPRPFGRGYLVIEYRMPGAAAYYMGDGEIIGSPLALPQELGGLDESIKGHLGASKWERWEVLRTAMNSHFDAVTKFWKEIEDSLAPHARRAGLIPSNTPADAPVDTYWPASFVSAIWKEREYYDANKVHSWDAVTIAMGEAVISMRHTLDTVQTFTFAGTNMLRSQSREPLEMMRQAWEDEYSRAEPIERELASERAKIEEEVTEFQKQLRHTLLVYKESPVLPGTCAMCQPWLDELTRAPR